MGAAPRYLRMTLLLTLLMAVLGCASKPKNDTDIHPSLIPTALLSGRDSLLLMMPTADEGLGLASGHMTQFQSILYDQLYGLVRSHLIPPVFMEGAEFRGEPAEIQVKITGLELSSHRRFFGLGREVTDIALEVELCFVDHRWQQPLGEWVDLSAIHGPAEGNTMSQALAAAAEQVCYHIARDRRGM